MEMPMDVLNKRLGQIRDNGDIDFDNTAAAVDIDSELQEKFIFFPREEIAAVEIDTDQRHQLIYAGDGPEEERAGLSANPAWVYNRALHCLALYQHLKDRQALEEEQAEIERKHREKMALRPKPGVYVTTTAATRFTQVVTEDRRVLTLNPSQGVFNDSTETWDGLVKEGRTKLWTMKRVDITDGTISA